MKLVQQILMEFHLLVTNQMTEIEVVAVTLIGDLKTLSLFYLPTITGKGSLKQPVPEPAPAMKDVYKCLRSLHSYLESLSARKLRESSTG